MYNTGLTPVSVHAAGSICCNVSMEHLALLLESFAAVGICFPFSSKAEVGRSHPLSLSGQPLSPGSPASLSRCPSGDFADTGQAGAAGGGGLGKGKPKRMESWVGTLQRTSGRLLGLLKDEPEGRQGRFPHKGEVCGGALFLSSPQWASGGRTWGVLFSALPASPLPLF